MSNWRDEAAHGLKDGLSWRQRRYRVRQLLAGSLDVSLRNKLVEQYGYVSDPAFYLPHYFYPVLRFSNPRVQSKRLHFQARRKRQFHKAVKAWGIESFDARYNASMPPIGTRQVVKIQELQQTLDAICHQYSVERIIIEWPANGTALTEPS